MQCTLLCIYANVSTILYRSSKHLYYVINHSIISNYHLKMKKNEEENICSENVVWRYCKSIFHLKVKSICVSTMLISDLFAVHYVNIALAIPYNVNFRFVRTALCKYEWKWNWRQRYYGIKFYYIISS